MRDNTTPQAPIFFPVDVIASLDRLDGLIELAYGKLGKTEVYHLCHSEFSTRYDALGFAGNAAAPNPPGSVQGSFAARVPDKGMGRLFWDRRVCGKVFAALGACEVAIKPVHELLTEVELP
jgi:hypothetical protein